MVCGEGESVRGLAYERGPSEPLTEAKYKDKQLVFIDPFPRYFYLGFVLMTEVEGILWGSEDIWGYKAPKVQAS